MLLVKVVKYIGFCVYRRSYLLWSPVIVAEACFAVGVACFGLPYKARLIVSSLHSGFDM